jgi:hypothetical protein
LGISKPNGKKGEMNLAKMRGKGIVVTALAAGVASYFSNKENRMKAAKMMKDVKYKTERYFSKETDFGEKQYNKRNNNDLKEIAETAADSTETKIRENNMIAESGLQTAIAYYNEQQQQELR